MTIHIRFLRDHEKIFQILKQSGWLLDQASGPEYAARHPAVGGEEAARDLLNDLGLLTSSAIRIQFEMLAS